MWITENNPANVNHLEGGLLEQILSPTNMNEAYKKVKSNHGSGGVDKMDVESLKDYLIENNKELISTCLRISRTLLSYAAHVVWPLRPLRL